MTGSRVIYPQPPQKKPRLSSLFSSSRLSLLVRSHFSHSLSSSPRSLALLVLLIFSYSCSSHILALLVLSVFSSSQFSRPLGFLALLLLLIKCPFTRNPLDLGSTTMAFWVLAIKTPGRRHSLALCFLMRMAPLGTILVPVSVLRTSLTSTTTTLVPWPPLLALSETGAAPALSQIPVPLVLILTSQSPLLRPECPEQPN